MRVSVVIPAFNQGPYLKEAIDSALNSTKPPHEVVVVDDGSTDNTSAVCASYGPRIVTIRQDNAGVSAARNAGLRAFTGEAVMLLDSDDILEPRWLEGSSRALAAARQRDPRVQVVHGDYVLFDDARTYERRISIKQVGLGQLLRDSTLLPSGLLLDRACVEAVGEFDGRVNTCEDWDYSLRTALLGIQFHHVSEPAFRHREHAESASKRQTKALEARLRFLNKWLETPSLARDHRAVMQRELVRTLLRCRRDAFYGGRSTREWTERAARELGAETFDPWLVSYGSVFVAPFFRMKVERGEVERAARTLAEEFLEAFAGMGRSDPATVRQVKSGAALALAADAAISRSLVGVVSGLGRAVRTDPRLMADALRRAQDYGREALRAWLTG